MRSSIGIYDNSVCNEGLFETIEKLVSALEPIISAYNEWRRENLYKLVSAFNFIEKNFSSLFLDITIDTLFSQTSGDQNTEQNKAEEVQRISNRELDYDVFLSHSNIDNMHTNEFDLKLRQHNFRVFYDRSCIKWGDFFNKDIKRALKSSTCAIFFVTPNFIESKYARKEYKWFFKLSHRNRNHNVFIVLYGVSQKEFNKTFPFSKFIQSKKFTGDIESLVIDFETIFIDRFSNEQKEVIT